MQTDVLLLFEGFTVWLVGLRLLKQAHHIAQAGHTPTSISNARIRGMCSYVPSEKWF